MSLRLSTAIRVVMASMSIISVFIMVPTVSVPVTSIGLQPLCL